MNDILIEFERRIGLGPTYAARLLGIAYPTYAAYRSEARVLPHYHVCHIRALFSEQPLEDYIKEHAYGPQRR